MTIAKCNAFAKIEGNEIWLITANHKGKTVIPIDERVHLLNLDIDYCKNDWTLSRLKRWIQVFSCRLQENQKLREALSRIHPDIIVSTGHNEKKIIPKIKIRPRPVLILEQHSTKNGIHYLPPIDRMIASVSNLEFDLLFRHRYDRVIVLSQEARKQELWHNNVAVIPNPLIWEHNLRSTLTALKAIYVGRLVEIKNVAALIRVWSIVNQTHPDWILEIYGEGHLKPSLGQLIIQLGLQKTVSLKGATADVITKMAEASFFVLSSLSESFGMVLVEAQSCGLPVVSYDCPDGPRSIITNGQNGFLVPLNDEEDMAKKICLLIEQTSLRQMMGKIALEKSREFTMDTVIGKYMSLFSELLEEKQRDDDA